MKLGNLQLGRKLCSDLGDYDTWLIEHVDQDIHSLTCRIFTESKLTVIGRYPVETYPTNDAGLTYGPDIKDNTNPAQELVSIT